jgi:hypothetical protein
MSKADPLAWLLEGLLAQSRQPVWRSIDRWRRRGSVLLAGLLGWIQFFLIAGIVFGRPRLAGYLGFGSLLAAPLGALVVAEGAFAIRPNQRLGLVGAMATAIGGRG